MSILRNLGLLLIFGHSSLPAKSQPDDQASSADQRTTMKRPLIISTWPFGKPANERALNVILAGGSALDGVEKGIHVAEADKENASVGLSGLPNAAGVVQQDACIIWGPGQKAGAVAAVEGIVHPISAARLVMEKSPHVMLVGKGAQWFAQEHGLKFVRESYEKNYVNWLKDRDRKDPPTKETSDENHDTISMLILDADGNLAAGCSTSGWGGKYPGRAGDAPIPGSGVYVDNAVGAAGATGMGENVMRYCASFMVVDFMRQGMDPEAACVATIERIAKSDPKGVDLSINFIAIDKQGRYGAAGCGNGFSYSVTMPGQSGVLKSAALSDIDTGPIGGNRFK